MLWSGWRVGLCLQAYAFLLITEGYRPFRSADTFRPEGGTSFPSRGWGGLPRCDARASLGPALVLCRDLTLILGFLRSPVRLDELEDGLDVVVVEAITECRHA